MGCLGNIIWFLFGGVVLGLSWAIVGLLWCLTIVGIPVGVQCFKFAGLCFAPFGKDIQYGGGPVSILLNILWLVFGGIELAVISAVTGFVFCVTIIGIPFGLQHFKLAKLALMPFGASVVNK
ncbi:MAG: Inner membrane protein YccF [Firmicutes bacterium ADurb.Bin182]|nr:MAG: Inner membrane protein YccF [Firmicutes bacterium ADurb.Bin182]